MANSEQKVIIRFDQESLRLLRKIEGHLGAMRRSEREVPVALKAEENRDG